MRARLAADKREQLLRFIWGYQIAHGGVSPALWECGRAIGRTKSSVHRLLGQLERQGAVRVLGFKGRAIEVVRKPALPSINGLPLFAVPLDAAGLCSAPVEAR